MEQINLITKLDLEVIHHALASLEVKIDKIMSHKEGVMPTKYVKASQAAKYFGFSRTVFDKFVAEGKIKAYLLEGRLGGDRFFKVQDIYDLEKIIMR